MAAACCIKPPPFRVRRPFASVVLAGACFPRLLFAGAWTQPEGQGIVILSGYYYDTSHYFDRDGHRRDQDDFTKFELNPYVEYGLTADWTVGASFFLDELNQDGDGESRSNQGLGNTDLFARYRLWHAGPWALALEPFVGLPAAYVKAAEPRSGHPDADTGMLAAAGYSFDLFGPKDFAEADAGYRHRFGALGDQWIIEAKAGFNVMPRLSIVPEADFVLPLGGLGSERVSVSGDNDYQLGRLQLSAVYELDDRWSVQAGAFLHAEGENTGGGGGGLLSLWRRF